MTTQQLIDQLRHYPPDSNIRIAINQYNKTYPIHYVEGDLTIDRRNGRDITIHASLPYGYYTVKGKDAQK